GWFALRPVFQRKLKSETWRADPGGELLPHLGSQSGERKGLLEQGNSLVQDAVVGDGILGIAGHVEHFGLLRKRGDATSQFASVHSRHDDVGQQQVDGAWMAIGNFYRRSPVSGFEHGVALVL